MVKAERKAEGGKEQALTKRVPIPEGVSVQVTGRTVRVSGGAYVLEKTFSDPRTNALISVTNDNGTVVVSATSDRKKVRAMTGTIVASVRRMITGVTSGYTYTMRIFSVHFPMNVTVKDRDIQIKNFLGEKTLRTTHVHGNVSIKVDKETIVVSGPSKEDVSQTCANIESAVRMSKKDRRIFQDGIYMESKSAR